MEALIISMSPGGKRNARLSILIFTNSPILQPETIRHLPISLEVVSLLWTPCLQSHKTAFFYASNSVSQHFYLVPVNRGWVFNNNTEMKQDPMGLPSPHELCLPPLCGKLQANKFNQGSEKMQKQRKTTEQDKTIIV